MARGRKTITSNFTSLFLDCSLFRILVERVNPVNTGNSPFQGGNPLCVDDSAGSPSRGDTSFAEVSLPWGSLSGYPGRVLVSRPVSD